ncbi:MAG: T9SS type A sorting domain-containing protein, partial [Luteibaculum sp.]
AASGNYQYVWSDPACGINNKTENYQVGNQQVVPEFDIDFENTQCGFDNGKANVITDGTIKYDYFWYNSDSSFTSLGQSLSGLAPGKYAVTVKFTGCASRTDSIEIEASDLVVGEVSSPVEKCPEESAKIWATGGDSLKWFTEMDSLFAVNVDTLTLDTARTSLFKVVFYGDPGCTLEKFTGINVLPRAKARAKVSNGIEDYGDTTVVDLKDGALALFSSSGTVSAGLKWFFGDSTVSTERNPSHAYKDEGFYEVLLFGANKGCDDYDTVWVKVEDSRIVGINEGKKSSIKLFPNPASNQLKISAAGSNLSNAAFRIYDIAGKTVLSGKTGNTQETAIDVSSLNPGLYILKLQGDKQELQAKFSISRD